MARKKRNTVSTKIQLYVATGTVLLLVAFGMVVGWLDASVGSTLDTSNVVSLKDVTLKGESVCLEHAGDADVTTLECAMGIKTANGAVYAIKGTATPAADDTLEVTGTLTTPSGDEVYKLDGTLTVK